MSEKASHLGLDWQRPEDVLAKIDEERTELGAALRDSHLEQVAHELGDLLFAAANLARKLHLDSEELLQRTIDRFASRVRQLEAAARDAGEDLNRLDPAELDLRWAAAKRVVDPSRHDR